MMRMKITKMPSIEPKDATARPTHLPGLHTAGQRFLQHLQDCPLAAKPMSTASSRAASDGASMLVLTPISAWHSFW